ncbi:MAG: hypothetical protein KIT87_07800 [Anaerolineae bacterium]|nr:hypothetical protein [Anaerolineae bacterium]
MQEPIASEILAAHADRLVAGEDATEDYMRLFPNTEGDLVDLMGLAVRLKGLLQPVRPRPQFITELRRDLLAVARQRDVGVPLPLLDVWREDAEQWVDYARRHLPDWTPPPWPERPIPRSWVLAALGLTGAGVWAYLRRRDEHRRGDIEVAAR